ncbi:S-protein homolog 6 [Rosa rugosa]|uniref:S-protein homolog 6 n=1 Tax=Rosa rugosa TaxID=74645 RepID=UPI002B416196|nr:S-protein homolog 6 [Rosa rugosa]
MGLIFRYQALLLALFIPFFVALTTAVVPFKVVTSIDNTLPDGQELNVHCKSGDDDLGAQVIPNGGHYEWSFKVNVWATTLFFCSFNCKDGSGTFDIYRASRDIIRCEDKCNWKAAQDGVHGFNKDNQDDFLYKWEAPQVKP